MCTVGQTKLEKAMETLVEVFLSYSDTSLGDRYSLSYLELKKLVQTELDCHVRRSWDPVEIARLMDRLDQNCDGTVCFEEMVFLVTQIVLRSHPEFKTYKPRILVCGNLDYQ